jgi:hypothetical protein
MKSEIFISGIGASIVKTVVASIKQTILQVLPPQHAQG